MPCGEEQEGQQERQQERICRFEPNQRTSKGKGGRPVSISKYHNADTPKVHRESHALACINTRINESIAV